MAKTKKTSEELGSKVEEKAKEAIKGYEKLINRLKTERKELQNELNRDYREARRYVRAHPEEGVLMAFVGGVVLGYIMGKAGK